MDKALKDYLKGGKYAVSVVDLPDRSGTFTVAPATAAQVELALGRFALGSNNLELAERHASTLIGTQPQSPEGYALLAHSRYVADDPAGAEREAMRAVERGSTDPSLYQLLARLQMRNHVYDDRPIDEALDRDRARTIADTLERSLALQPRNTVAIQLLVMALANVSDLTDADRRALDAAQRYLPRSGLMLVVRAIAANRAGDLESAITLLQQARDEDRELPRQLRTATKNLDEYWLLNRLSDQAMSATSLVALDELDATLAAATKLREPSANLQSTVKSLGAWSRGARQLMEAGAAAEYGDYAKARGHLQAVIDDPDAPADQRANAERGLRELAGY
jgi:hypothetical protein